MTFPSVFLDRQGIFQQYKRQGTQRQATVVVKDLRLLRINLNYPQEAEA